MGCHIDLKDGRVCLDWHCLKAIEKCYSNIVTYDSAFYNIVLSV